MVKDFDTIWAQVIQKLQPGQIIKSWGLARGYTGGSFRIEEVRNGTITVSGGNMVQSRTIARADFAKVFAVWDDYLAGNYPRAKMTNLSQNTTYILSIFREVLGE